MSIRSLTRGDISRKIAKETGVPRVVGEAGLAEQPTSGEKKAPDANDAVDVIMKYIPSEAIALYIAALPILSSLNSAELPSSLNATTNYLRSLLIGFINIDKMYLILAFAFLTAIIVVLIYAGDYAKEKGKWEISKRECWPSLWSIVSAVIAFIVWAWAIPNPLAEGGQVNVSATSTFILIATSIFLPLIGQVVAPNQES